MATTIEDLSAMRDKLIRARLSGVREVRDANGEQVRYATDAEMARALAALDAEISRLAGNGVREIKFRTSKGI